MRQRTEKQPHFLILPIIAISLELIFAPHLSLLLSDSIKLELFVFVVTLIVSFDWISIQRWNEIDSELSR